MKRIEVNEMQFYNQKVAQIDTELPPSKFNSMVLDKQLKHIDSELYKGKIVLDAGCGDGRFIRYFAERGAKMAIGMDISRDYMISKSREDNILVYNKKVKVNRSRKVFFIHSNVENVPLKNGSIDTIVAFALLHHIPEKSDFISECQRVLVKGGRLVIVDPNGGHFLRNLMNKFGRKIGFLTETESAIDIEQLKEILNHTSFSIQQAKFESFFGDISVHLSFVVFKKSRLFGKMIQYLTPFCFMFDLFLDATLFKIFPSLAWRYFLLSRKENI